MLYIKSLICVLKASVLYTELQVVSRTYRAHKEGIKTRNFNLKVLEPHPSFFYRLVATLPTASFFPDLLTHNLINVHRIRATHNVMQKPRQAASK